MDTDDMPDFMAAAPAPGEGGTADEMLDEADELENLLEDALEEAEEEEAEETATAPMSADVVTNDQVFSPVPLPNPIAALGNKKMYFPLHPLSSVLILCLLFVINFIFSGRSFIQNTTQSALETMPRTTNGLIDVEKLTPEQHRVYNAYVLTLES
jgi:hypothetical protein